MLQNLMNTHTARVYINETLDFPGVSHRLGMANMISNTQSIWYYRLVRKWYNPTRREQWDYAQSAEKNRRDGLHVLLQIFDFGAAGIPGGEAPSILSFFIYRNATGTGKLLEFSQTELGRAIFRICERL